MAQRAHQQQLASDERTTLAIPRDNASSNYGNEGYNNPSGHLSSDYPVSGACGYSCPDDDDKKTDGTVQHVVGTITGTVVSA
ncbi:hypothetical protein ACMFMG_001988 [Clarireedia jacksonii]